MKAFKWSLIPCLVLCNFIIFFFLMTLLIFWRCSSRCAKLNQYNYSTTETQFPRLSTEKNTTKRVFFFSLETQEKKKTDKRLLNYTLDYRCRLDRSSIFGPQSCKFLAPALFFFCRVITLYPQTFSSSLFISAARAGRRVAEPR